MRTSDGATLESTGRRGPQRDLSRVHPGVATPHFVGGAPVPGEYGRPIDVARALRRLAREFVADVAPSLKRHECARSPGQRRRLKARAARNCERKARKRQAASIAGERDR